jgi:putative sugar O-methyltransferase
MARINTIKSAALKLKNIINPQNSPKTFCGEDFSGGKRNRSVCDDGKYIRAVKDAFFNYESFRVFKRDPRYTSILEHVSVQHGAEYLKIIEKESPTWINKFNEFKENDLEGGASTHNYDGFGYVSPSTLRYVKVASDLKNLFGDHIQGVIAEIGVGYGGQLLVNDKVLRFGDYHLFDLPPVLQLASKYLECHVLNNSYKVLTLNQHAGNIEYDLVISNYAFSELPSELQLKYIYKILSKSKRGYLTMNSGLPNSAFQIDKLSLPTLRTLLPMFNVIKERPLTHPGNYIIVWGL